MRKIEAYQLDVSQEIFVSHQVARHTADVRMTERASKLASKLASIEKYQTMRDYIITPDFRRDCVMLFTLIDDLILHEGEE